MFFRYYILEKKHGKLDPLAKVSLKPKKTYNVIIVNSDNKKERMEVSINQTVRELKKSLQNVAGLPTNKFALFYKDSITPNGADRLRNLDKKLYALNLNDGDQFIIHPL